MACTIKAGSRVGCSTGSRQRGERDGGWEGGWEGSWGGGFAQRRAGTDGEEVSQRTKRLSEESRLVIV